MPSTGVRSPVTVTANLRARVNGFMAIESSGDSGFRVGCGIYCPLTSQLLSRDDGPWCWCCRRSARVHAGVWRYLNELLAADNPISGLKVFDLREKHGEWRWPGVPAVARGVDRRRRRAVNPAVMMNDTLFNALNDWVDRYYRDRLTAADLANPQLLREGREALDTH
ncbi:N-succinylarginine dihydrolase [Shigella sonnei]